MVLAASVTEREKTADLFLQQLDVRVAEGANLGQLQDLLYASGGWLETYFPDEEDREQFLDQEMSRLRRCLLWAEFNAPNSQKSLHYTANDAMTTSLVTASIDTRIFVAQKLLLDHKISAVPIVDENEQLIGLLSEADILNFYSLHGGQPKTVGECMNSRRLVTVHRSELLTTIIQIFSNHPYRRIPVVEKRRLVGLISRRDMIRFIDCLYLGDRGELKLDVTSM
jgi:CBS domain-containing protein